MDFALSPRAEKLHKRLEAFMDECVYPNEALYQQQIAESGDPHVHAPVLDELKLQARERGLWNLFLPHETEGSGGLSNLDYAPLAEMTGHSPLAPESLNCSAPDTGNMELLTMFGTEEQKERWLRPLLEGEIRSCFAMTEPFGSSGTTTTTCSTGTNGGSAEPHGSAAGWRS
jgi:acyl-CoA dehydrogenase